jgi:hypothetical protein
MEGCVSLIWTWATARARQRSRTALVAFSWLKYLNWRFWTAGSGTLQLMLPKWEDTWTPPAEVVLDGVLLDLDEELDFEPGMTVGQEFPGPPDGVYVPTVEAPTMHVQSPSPSSRLGLLHSKAADDVVVALDVVTTELDLEDEIAFEVETELVFADVGMAVGQEFPGPPEGVNVPTVEAPSIHVHSPSPSSRLGLVHPQVAEADELDFEDELDREVEIRGKSYVDLKVGNGNDVRRLEVKNAFASITYCAIFGSSDVSGGPFSMVAKVIIASVEFDDVVVFEVVVVCVAEHPTV